MQELARLSLQVLVDLSAFTADIEFDVVDNAAGLIAEMNGTDPAGFLTEANSITVNDLSTGRVVGANDGAILASFTADVDFDVVDSAQAIAAELSAHGAGSLDEAADVVASGSIVDAEDAAAIMQISEYNTAGSQFEISDDVASVISAGDSVIENGGVSKVTVTDIANASDGALLNDYSANVEFDVQDTADAIAANATNLGKADDVVVVSGDVTIAEAQSIQGLSGYDASASAYEIEDSAAHITASNDQLMQNGNIHVDVTDANVTASVGADLAAFTADIDFDVADTAANIAAQIAAGNAAGYGANSLEDAQSVVVESGNPVDVVQAEAVQDLVNYSGGDMDITDTASALISAGDHVLNVNGVDHITTTENTVLANTGALLAGFTADVHFDVDDSVTNLAAVMGRADAASHLTEAQTITVDDGNGGSEVTAQDGALLAGFTADVHFDVEDDVSDLKAVMGQNDAASYLTEANSITVDNDGSGDRVVGANDGAILASFTADVDFDVVDSAQAIAAELSAHGAGSLDEAADVVASGSIVSASQAAGIQQISEYNDSGSNYDIRDDVAAVISAGSGVIEDDGVFKVEVTGIADASEGVALNTYSANVEFDVEDTADAIAANATNLGKADEVFVESGGADVTVAQAESIQNLSGYDAGRSEFNITDNSAAVISATDSVLTDGHIHVDVTNTVGASDGAILNAFSADIDFDVADTAENIAAEVNYRRQMMRAIDFSPLSGISEVDDVLVQFPNVCSNAMTFDLRLLMGDHTTQALLCYRACEDKRLII